MLHGFCRLHPHGPIWQSRLPHAIIPAMTADLADADHPHQDHLTGLVERVTFHSPDTGFAVLQVKVRGRRDLVTIVGTLPSVTPGEWLDAQGRWTISQQYGQQFKAETIRISSPSTPEGIEKFLGSGLIRGIGPRLAVRLVHAFGTGVFDVIEQTPGRLLEVDGIGEVRRGRILAAWDEQKTVHEIMVFLQSHGVSTSRAFRIYKTYGAEAIEKVQEDPYRLARDIWGIGFKTADQIAASLGIDRQSPLRARAGVEYVLQDLTEAGHCAYARDALAERAVKMLEIPLSIVEAAIDEGIEAERLVAPPRPDGTVLVYLASLYACEVQLAQDLMELTRAPHPCPPINLPRAVRWAEQQMGLKLAPAQREALAQAVSSKVMVITGGPGVGKTTLLHAIVKVFRAKGLEVVLSAPTGRAAKRMAETSGVEARTIHRLLEFDPATGGFKRNRQDPLDGDVFIVDESSMIDLVLAHQLVRAIPKHAALILVGDVDQLPSVGPGSVLRDIIDSRAIATCRLTEIFRQAARSAIVTNAHRVNQGQMPRWPDPKAAEQADTDFYFVESPDPDRALQVVLRLVQKRIPERFGFDALDDIQVLTPMQRGDPGVRKLNQVLQAALNPSGPEVKRYGWTFRTGDKVMQTVNDYEKDVFNGDIGRIAEVDQDEGDVVVRFDDRKVRYAFAELDELALSYATTIHKSQGSEYRCVVVPIHMQHYMLLQRNLLYTAITRGRELVVMVGRKKALAVAVRQVGSRRRITTLRERLGSRAIQV
jgi:exodeoxyribonuclease V alpha subunit